MKYNYEVNIQISKSHHNPFGMFAILRIKVPELIIDHIKLYNDIEKPKDLSEDVKNVKEIFDRFFGKTNVNIPFNNVEPYHNLLITGWVKRDYSKKYMISQAKMIQLQAYACLKVLQITETPIVVNTS